LEVGIIMFKTRKEHFTIFLLWFPIVSISIYFASFLSALSGDLLFNLRGATVSAGNDGFGEWVISFIVLGELFVGFAQWIAINTKFKKAYKWIPATVIGLFVGIFISVIFSALSEMAISNLHKYPYERWLDTVDIINSILNPLINLFLIGATIGIFQCISLKRDLSTSFKWAFVYGLSLIAWIPAVFLFQSPSNVPLILSVSIGLVTGIFAEPILFRSEIQETS
jgi:hypothetical protein